MENKYADDVENGIVIGQVLAISDGHPLVIFPSNTSDEAIQAKTLQPMTYQDIGKDVALLFEDGDLRRPIIMGRIVSPTETVPAPQEHEEKILRLSASARLELRCGEASVILTQDGRIRVRGTDVVNRASGSHRILGGSVHIN